MKLKCVLAVLAILGAVSCASCASTGGGKSGAVDLDTAIQNASKDINDSLSSGTKVALLNFTSGSDVLSDYVIEEMSIALVKGRKLTVVDRKEIDLIRGEMNFQMSGEVSDESAQEIGRLLGAQSIVSGSLVNMGENHRFRTKVINVKSAAIETSASIPVVDDPQIQFLLGQGKSSAPQTATAQGSGTRAIPTQADTTNQAQSATPAPAPAEPAFPAYKIGDTGPAGGLIFYDKGSDSDGWRYLEVAPQSVETIVDFGIATKIVETTTAIGRGKENTQRIVNFLVASNLSDKAAQYAVSLNVGGYKDWFLPSKDELNLLYNLWKKDFIFGGLKADRYWTSSIDSNSGFPWSQNFSDGRQYGQQYINYYGIKYYVRPIRQVPGPAR